MSEPKFNMETSEAARYLGVSLGTIRRWADEGFISHYRTPGGQRRFSKQKLDEFAKNRLVRRST